ncbi:MAG TPA: tripartite tricarboxylate transporter TctB family protein [Methylomirabilota bacterium]|nr:tripartite tricarboxylate transporter TctB family protein [Methylomirabilota bacterium]
MTRLLPPLAGAALAVGLLLASRGLDDVAREGQLGPGFWPRLVLVGLALACLVKLAADWRQRRRWPIALRAADDAKAEEISRPRLAAGIALIVLYALATPWIGFALATSVFVAAFMTLAGARSPVVIGANALGGTVVLLYVFVRLVYLPLPKGAGAFESITLALYRALHLF